MVSSLTRWVSLTEVLRVTDMVRTVLSLVALAFTDNKSWDRVEDTRRTTISLKDETTTNPRATTVIKTVEINIRANSILSNTEDMDMVVSPWADTTSTTLISAVDTDTVLRLIRMACLNSKVAMMARREVDFNSISNSVEINSRMLRFWAEAQTTRLRRTIKAVPVDGRITIIPILTKVAGDNPVHGRVVIEEANEI
jgi:hypothetical protein